MGPLHVCCFRSGEKIQPRRSALCYVGRVLDSLCSLHSPSLPRSLCPSWAVVVVGSLAYVEHRHSCPPVLQRPERAFALHAGERREKQERSREAKRSREGERDQQRPGERQIKRDEERGQESLLFFVVNKGKGSREKGVERNEEKETSFLQNVTYRMSS